MATKKLSIQWNAPADCWVIDIMESDGTPVAQGLAAVTGADLLEQLAYLGLGGQLIVQTDHDTDAVPTYANLGSAGHIYFLTP